MAEKLFILALDNNHSNVDFLSDEKLIPFLKHKKCTTLKHLFRLIFVPLDNLL
jgi:hypothetical protein